MDDVLKKLEEVRFALGIVEGHKKVAEKTLRRAREMIMSGSGSSGDLLRDCVIVTAKEDSKELVEALRATEALLSGKIGELILFVHTWMDNSSTINIGNVFGRITMKSLFLGIIVGSKLILDPQKERYDFPVGKLIEGGDRGFYFGDPTPGMLVIKSIITPKRIVATGDFFMPAQFWEVAVGSEDVIGWMKKNPAWRYHVIDMVNKIGKPEDLGMPSK